MSVGLTRRSAVGLVSSVPVSATPLSRSDCRSGLGLPPRSRRVALESAAGSSIGSTSASPLGPSARCAAASAPSSPTSAAVVVRSWTASSRLRSGGAPDDAREKSVTAVVPSSRSNTFSARRSPCAMRSPSSRPTLRHASSSTASVMRSGATSVSGTPSGSRITSSAMSSGPPTPAITTSRTGTPARSESSNKYARCSNCWGRVRVRLAPESLYQIIRQTLANRRASVASRPITSIETAPPSGAAATKRVSPHTWFGESVNSSTTTPSSTSAFSTWSQRRCRGRGPHGEVERGRDAPRERDTRNDVFGKSHGCEQRAQRAEDHQRLHGTSRRAEKIRRGDEQHRHRDGEHDDRVLRARTMELEPGGLALRLGVDHRAEADRAEPAEPGGDAHDQQQPEAAREEERKCEHDDRARRPDVVSDLGALAQPRRQTDDEVVAVPLRTHDVRRAQPGDHHDHRRGRESDEVARPAPARALRHHAEDGGRPLPGRDRRQDPETRSPLRDRHPISLVHRRTRWAESVAERLALVRAR